MNQAMFWRHIQQELIKCSARKQCTAEMSFRFNDGTKLELDYYDNMFNDKAGVKFRIEIQ